MPEIYHVVARARNRVIGINNELPWHFPSDMKHFKELTGGQTVIMGRKTYESIPEKFRPLPNRKNFVLSRSETESNHESLFYFKTINNALNAVDTEKAFIIGGASIYEQTLDYVDGIYLTLIHQDYEGDAYYPELPENFKEEKRDKLQKDPLLEVIFYKNHRKQSLAPAS